MATKNPWEAFLPAVPALPSGFSAFPVPGNAFWKASMDTWISMATIATMAPQVIGMRLTGLAIGGATPANQREVNRMINEKLAAAVESSRVLNSYFLSLGATLPLSVADPKAANRLLTRSARTANRSLTPYKRRVNANAKRLAS